MVSRGVTLKIIWRKSLSAIWRKGAYRDGLRKRARWFVSAAGVDHDSPILPPWGLVLGTTDPSNRQIFFGQGPDPERFRLSSRPSDGLHASHS